MENLTNTKIKAGSILLTWLNTKVEVVNIITDTSKKPLEVVLNGRLQYFHFDQIKKILK